MEWISRMPLVSDFLKKLVGKEKVQKFTVFTYEEIWKFLVMASDEDWFVQKLILIVIGDFEEMKLQCISLAYQEAQCCA